MSKYFGKCFSPSTRAPKFSTQMLRFFFSKLCFIIKVSTICGAGRDTRNLCLKFNSQGPALRILGFMITCSKFQGPSSRVLGVTVLCSRVPGPGSWVSRYRVPGFQSPRVLALVLSVPGLRS